MSFRSLQMEDKDLRFRTLLMSIDENLSRDNRDMLGFLLNDDVPRREIDAIRRDNRASMSNVWEALISRQKISPDDVQYLIDCLKKIQRIDLVRRLEHYSSTTQATHRVETPAKSSSLFERTDP